MPETPESAAAGAPLASPASLVETYGLRLSHDHLAFINRQIGSLVRMDFPLARGVKAIVNEARHPKLRRVLESISRDLEKGLPLATALSRFPHAFPALHLELIRAGEATGTLAATLNELADFEEIQESVANRVRNAVVYPFIVGAVTLVFLFLLLLFAVPRFQELYGQIEKVEVELPLITSVIFGASSLLNTPLVSIPFAVLAAFAIFWGYRTLSAAGGTHSQLALNLPGAGRIFRLLSLVRACRTLGDLLQNNVPMVQALELTGRTLGENDVREGLRLMAQAAESGKSVFNQKFPEGVFPDTMILKLQMAEERGTVESTLLDLAGEYNRELEKATIRLSQVLEPALILCFAFLVGLTFLGIYLPIITLSPQVAAMRGF